MILISVDLKLLSFLSLGMAIRIQKNQNPRFAILWLYIADYDCYFYMSSSSFVWLFYNLLNQNDTTVETTKKYYTFFYLYLIFLFVDRGPLKILLESAIYNPNIRNLLKIKLICFFFGGFSVRIRNRQKIRWIAITIFYPSPKRG